ncbi:L-2-amino-thiazoline-4-carboxylic acid hydrolase [Amycolatopsis nigrescens]|uniref:L-2-amino-thiazoline-4-carboxylic acid hydrolase n=1 Tax=Amycolatopsis nigrescens TaxID=381445 RepID=UPI000382D726|nr:L-2-amino-thiazoline-4-carboxylic acid hydrolase [Amycolatopsis nigrescens]
MTTDQFGLSDGDYTPDPEKDLALLIEGYYEQLARTLHEHGLDPELLTAIKRRHAELEAANAGLVVDEPARHNLKLTLALVAGYRSLRPELGRDRAIAAVEAAFVEPFAEDMRAGTRAMLDAAPDPFSAMVEMAKSREELAFGKGFTFRRPVDDDQRYLLDVHRCFYHDVLVANSAAELTPSMCAFDQTWIDGIDPERHGFRFDRATTIGLGGTHCPFHFTRE